MTSGFCRNIPLFSIILALISSVVSSLLPRKAARILTLCLCGAVSVFSGILALFCFQNGEDFTFMMGHYPHPWGNELRFGILEPFLVCVFSMVELCSILGGKKQLEEDIEDSKGNLYYVLADLILVSLLSLCYTNDLFTGYVFIEICTLSSCGLLMIRQIGRTTLASIRYMIFSLIGSGLFLLGVILLYGVTGHLLMPDLLTAVRGLAESGAYRLPLMASAVLMLVGLAVKSGLFPFHFWMPDTYGAATPSSSGILSGLVSKGYIFLLLKIIFRVLGTDLFYGTGLHNVFFVLGICGIVIGSVEAIRSKNLFRMLAYSSAAQIGYVYMGIGLSPALGVTAALFHMLAHALTKPLLFLSGAQLKDASENGSLDALKGSGYRNPLAAFTFTVGALSMAGIPSTVGFVCKYYHAVAGLNADSARMIAVLSALAVSTVLNAVYFSRAVLYICLRNNSETKPPRVRNVSFAVAAVCLCAVNLSIGLNPGLVNKIVQAGLSLL